MNMNVPFVDFSEQYHAIKDAIEPGLRAVFEKGNFILGEEQKAFERQFAKFCDSRFAVGVNSGTDALYMALGALEIGPGDEVVIPTFTFIATALCISYTGATPVFCEIEEETYNIDPQKLEEVITDRTKAIIPVHLYGQTADMDEINAIAKKHHIAVVEDACQAHGATYNGKKAGALGDIGCFSFYPTKSLGAFGDAGMVVTNKEEVFEKIGMLRDYGRIGRYEHKVKGFNSRMDTIQAVILAAKLEHLPEWNRMRNAHATYYNELIKDVTEVVLPQIKENRTHVFQTYAVRLANRDKILEGMKAKGIGALIHYPIPVHLQEAYMEAGGQPGDFPVSERVANEILSLPMFPHLSQEQIEYVCMSLRELCAADQKV
jgi:dTDP-4-amino-4,6-dideoxygalactose transaminase